MKLTLNGVDVDLANAVVDITFPTTTAAATTAPPASGAGSVTVSAPAPAPAPVALSAGFAFAVAGATVAFTDESTGAAKSQIIYGDGGAVNLAAGAPIPSHTYRTAGTRTAKQIVWDAAGHALTVEHDITTTADSSPAAPIGPGTPAPAPISTNPPVVPPAAPTATGAHAVAVTVLDAAGKTWSVMAHVGEDWTVDGQYCAVYDSTGAPHPGIRCRIYSDCADVGACPGSNALDYAGTLTVTYDGTPVFGPQAVRFDRGCMNQTIRYGKQAPWKPVNPKLFPNYATPSAPLPLNNYSSKDLSYNGFGLYNTTAMGVAGMHENIAFVPGWDVPFVMQPSDESFAVVREAADNSGAWCIYWIDDNTGNPYDLTQYPQTSMLPWSQVKFPNNPIVDYGVVWKISATKGIWDAAHQTAYNFVAAAATGTARDKWHASVHANAPLIASNSFDRQSSGIVAHVQERATAWGLRSLFLAAHVSSMPDYFAARLDEQRMFAEKLITHPLGFQATYVTRQNEDGSKATAPWEENYTRLVVGVIVGLHPEWQEIQTRLNRWFEIMRKPYYQLATHYKMGNQNADGTPLTTWEDVVTHTLAGEWSDADITTVLSPALNTAQMTALIQKYVPTWPGKVGDFDANYPTSCQDYGAILMAAVAQNLGDGPEWAVCQSIPTKPNWALGWQWNVVPIA